MAECINFTCRFITADRCSFSGEPCHKSCKGYYAKCDACGARECEFKYNFLKDQKDFINRIEYRKALQSKPKNVNRVYAVKNGRNIGIYHTWEECLSQIDGYMGAQYQAFTKMEDAQDYIYKSDEQMKDDEIPYAYVDGSFNAYKKVYGYGCYVYDGTAHELSGSGMDPEMASMRNVAGEIEGAMAAMRYAQEHGFQKMELYYDYSGIEAWATGKWQANKQGTRNYMKFCQKCPVEIIFKKVKAHSGVKGNEIADQLAKRAVGIR